MDCARSGGLNTTSVLAQKALLVGKSSLMKTNKIGLINFLEWIIYMLCAQQQPPRSHMQTWSIINNGDIKSCTQIVTCSVWNFIHTNECVSWCVDPSRRQCPRHFVLLSHWQKPHAHTHSRARIVAKSTGHLWTRGTHKGPVGGASLPFCATRRRNRKKTSLSVTNNFSNVSISQSHIYRPCGRWRKKQKHNRPDYSADWRADYKSQGTLGIENWDRKTRGMFSCFSLCMVFTPRSEL